jgi:queuosine precursor transporter
MGTLLIGATFIFRDLVQNKYGSKKTYIFIEAALLLSALVSFILENPGKRNDVPF